MGPWNRIDSREGLTHLAILLLLWIFSGSPSILGVPVSFLKFQDDKFPRFLWCRHLNSEPVVPSGLLFYILSSTIVSLGCLLYIFPLLPLSKGVSFPVPWHSRGSASHIGWRSLETRHLVPSKGSFPRWCRWSDIQRRRFGLIPRGGGTSSGGVLVYVIPRVITLVMYNSMWPRVWGGRLVVSGEPYLRYLKGFVKIVFTRFFPFRDLVSSEVRWKAMCYCLEYPLFILRTDCCFL